MPARFVRLLVLLLAIALPAAGRADEATARNPLERFLAAIGLFESTIQPEPLERGDAEIDDPDLEVLDDDEDGDGQPDPKRGEPFVAPIPFRSPSIGWGGALAAGYIFRVDRDDRSSPPSTVAIAGFGTENESFGGLVTGKLHLAEDRWRVSGRVTGSQVNYDFYGIGSEAGNRGVQVELEAESVSGSADLLRRLPDALKLLGVPVYLGPTVLLSETENSVSRGKLPADVSPRALDETRVGLGVRLQRDSRDDSFYPKSGSLGDAGFLLYDGGLGSDFNYRVYDVSYRRHDELWEEGVLATRAFGRFTDGNAPFTDLSGHDLRG
jgi:hypothetical protein